MYGSVSVVLRVVALLLGNIMSMLSRIKAESETRNAEQKRVQDRRKHILIYLQRHLTNLGYMDSAASVARETNLSELSKYEGEAHLHFLVLPLLSSFLVTLITLHSVVF